jgi:hypothetical protein
MKRSAIAEELLESLLGLSNRAGVA